MTKVIEFFLRSLSTGIEVHDCFLEKDLYYFMFNAAHDSGSRDPAVLINQIPC